MYRSESFTAERRAIAAAHTTCVARKETPLLLAHAGNRPDMPERRDARFPPDNVEDVRTRLGRLLAALRPEGIVSAAAAGSDLLVLEEAVSRGIPVHLVMPLPTETFEQRSVADLGAHWVRSYRRILDVARADPNTITELGWDDSDDWYWRANRAILDRAKELARTLNAVLGALAVRPRVLDDGTSVTDDFVARAHQQQLPVVNIDPTRRRAQLLSAFVVMPYGTKPDPSTGSPFDCDAVFDKLIVPALENADLDWERADRSVDAGMIHIDMIDRLANADVVLADLVTDNANVYYELGLRHALADKVTVLIARSGTRAPFDVRDIRRFTYEAAGTVITDREAVAGWTALERVLESSALAAAPVDSPVFSIFTLTTPRVRRRDRTDAYAQRVSRLRAAVTAAEQLGRVTDLEHALDVLQDKDPAGELEPDDRAGLLLRLGVALRRALSPMRAAVVLRSVQLPVDHPAYVEVQRELGLALRRQGDVERARGEDPASSWTDAADALTGALTADPRDPETLGIMAGLRKQLAAQALIRGNRDEARRSLEWAAELYDRAVVVDPANYYVLLNVISTRRLLAQHFDRPSHIVTAGALLPVAEYHAQHRAEADGEFWAVVTVAELMLSRHLLALGSTLHDAVMSYEAAARRPAAPDDWNSVRNQLEMYRLAGDPSEVIEAIHAVIPKAKADLR
jgi:tetratricopeptide (TPR) repeat protein